MEVRCLEIFEYAALVQLSHDGEGCELLERFMAAMGPAGSGLVGVRGVPSLFTSRSALLPFARFLTFLPPLQRSNLLKEHGLGTDVSFKDPDRLVSSFATQLSFKQEKKHRQMTSSDNAYPVEGKDEDGNTSCGNGNDGLMENEVSQLGSLFRQLGEAMAEVGLLVARICDMAIPGVGLEEAILEACTAKGRLIHYHSLVERLFLRAILSCSGGSKVRKAKKCNQFGISLLTHESVLSENIWQDWHFDYGIFTVLTVPMFLSFCEMDTSGFDHIVSPELKASFSSSKTESDALSRHIGLKVLNTGVARVEYVSIPADCLIIQVGEAAQILTGGKLQATAHCVCRPAESHDISRETFVVFLQPAWHRRLSWPTTAIGSTAQGHGMKDLVHRTNATFEEDFQKIHRKIPALESRWKDGSTFAEFSRETTKQYYGANGAQQART